MQKSAITVALAGLLASGAASAQTSVTLYGIVDAGFMTQSNSGTPSAGRTTSFVDAQLLPSIYGFKGTEDLGGGLTAGFNLEGGFNSGNGTHNSPGVYQTQTFAREADITLSGNWGTVAAGLQLDPAIIASVATEPRGLTNSFSMVEYWIAATAGNNAAGGGALQGGIFDQNALSYSYTGNGLYFGAEYGFGGVAGSATANTTESIGASYSVGGFLASAGYARDNNVNPAVGGSSSRIDNVGVGYDFGSGIAARLQYGEFKFNYIGGSNAASDVKVWGIGADWHTSVANKINLSYYDARDQGANPAAGGSTTQLALLDIYALSKHTQLYGQVVQVDADKNAGASSVIGGVGAYTAAKASAGNNTLYFGVGLQHAF